MKIYFDRTVPFYLTTTPSFDGTLVDVPVKAVKQAQALRELEDTTEAMIVNGAGPENYNQELAEYFAKGLADIFKGKTNGS